jgi:hypothetical protein
MKSTLASFQQNDHLGGFLELEDPASKGNCGLIDGDSLAKLLASTGVRGLVMNACRSAFSQPPLEPSSDPDEEPGAAVAFSSLAARVAASNIAVVASRYKIFVGTATDFLTVFYQGIHRGSDFGRAATAGRRFLADRNRKFGEPAGAWPIIDWIVPVIFQSEEFSLGKRRRVSTEEPNLPRPGNESLPPRPVAGFVGRDTALLALDRAYDRSSVVLLHGEAGSGKTSAATEFARWYRLTGGAGYAVFTTFEHHKTLARAMAEISSVLSVQFHECGIELEAIGRHSRPAAVLKAISALRVLWIWDNVESIAGFPSGAESEWTKQDQTELAGFLANVTATTARILLTSRRPETIWLASVNVERVALSPMAFDETAELARGLQKVLGIEKFVRSEWSSLLTFARGNPLTITVLVNQALRFGLRDRTEVERFVESVRSGAARFEDASSEGRAASLTASLTYGFEHAFTELQRRALTLLYLFAGCVNVRTLALMSISSLVLKNVPPIERLTGSEAAQLHRPSRRNRSPERDWRRILRDPPRASLVLKKRLRYALLVKR